jgi:hypothetical protein
MANLDRGNIAIGTAAAANDSLMACDIAQLEDLFAAFREDIEALRGLQYELRYRYSPNALALLKQVQDVLDAREQACARSRLDRAYSNGSGHERGPDQQARPGV